MATIFGKYISNPKSQQRIPIIFIFQLVNMRPLIYSHMVLIIVFYFFPQQNFMKKQECTWNDMPICFGENYWDWSCYFKVVSTWSL